MKKILIMILSFIMTFTFIPLHSFASETIPADKTGSITLTLKFKGTSIKDGSFSCIQIADVISEDADYYFRQLLDNTVVYRNGIPDADDIYELVKKNPDYFTQEKGTKFKYSNTTGTVIFGSLKPGLYLIVQDTESKGYTKLKPFLVSVPYNVDGKYIYDVNASAKLELEPKFVPESSNPTTPSSPSLPGETIPPTGQLTWPIPVLASSGMILFIFGWWLIFGGRKEKYHA